MISTRCISPTDKVCTGRVGIDIHAVLCALGGDTRRHLCQRDALVQAQPDVFRHRQRVNRLKCWNTMAMPNWRASWGLRILTGLPSNSTWPSSGLTVP